ncbi:hypothetical protein B0H14DRAFT_3471918 [Mycena olivaceomarginata]|nr:hypothetical protein B0H14DRAFT_3471918 [Mycena olivaceomarginata]
MGLKPPTYFASLGLRPPKSEKDIRRYSIQHQSIAPDVLRARDVASNILHRSRRYATPTRSTPRRRTPSPHPAPLRRPRLSFTRPTLPVAAHTRRAYIVRRATSPTASAHAAVVRHRPSCSSPTRAPPRAPLRIPNTAQQLRRPFCIADAAFVASSCTTAFLPPSMPCQATHHTHASRRHLTALNCCGAPRLHSPHGTTTSPSTIRIRSTRSSRSPYPPPPGSPSRPPRPSSPIIAYAGPSLPPCPTVGATAGG